MGLGRWNILFYSCGHMTKKFENLKNGAPTKKYEVKKSTAGWTMNHGCFITLA